MRTTVPTIPATVTAPTGRLPHVVAAAPAAPCPPWCNLPGAEHEWCEGTSAHIDLGDQGAALAAYLFRLDNGTPVLAVYSDNSTGAELHLAGADALIEDIETFLPKLRAMRAQLAAAAQTADGVR